jgi:nuclease S1
MRATRCVTVRVAVVIALGALPANAWAWGAHAHRIATRIAESRLTPAARSAVRELLHQGDTLVDIANWADHDGHEAVPGSAPWHYVNVSIDAAHYDPRDCPSGGCVVEKIKHFRKVLADRRAPRAERSRALLFLVHLVADVHQPLHVGDNRDRGGNDTQVQFFDQGTNMHRLWDSGLIARGGDTEDFWLADLAAMDTSQAHTQAMDGAVEDWATESLLAARQAYREPTTGRRIRPGQALADAYLEANLPVVRQRLYRGGIRLAMVLNAIWPAGR